MGLEAGIWALRLGFGPRGWDFRGSTLEEEKEKEKFPRICESIGHQPLRGRYLASPLTSSTTYLGRDQVPLTI